MAMMSFQLLLSVAVPVVVVAAFVAARLLSQRRRLGSALPFQCTQCGYDLRGSIRPGTVTCPECGSTFA
jgi:predicted Zn-ribbon and HTH transcriptional regulator